MTVKRQVKSIALASAATVALTSAMPAIAQESGEGARTLGTITVTATQREESIQDVPIAVTALDPEMLERAGVQDITSLDSVSSSFNMNTSDTQTGGITLRIRGVGTTGNNIGLESSVAVFLDGVYLSRPGIALADLLDLEQVEILRGPQGTLFGRNTSAGALNIKTRKPDLSDFSSFVNGTYGNYSLLNVQAGVNIPLVEDSVALRISGAIRNRDGFVRGINGDDSQSADRDRLTLRGQFLWDADSAGSLRVILDYAEANDQCCDAVWFQDSSVRAVFPATALDPVGGAPHVGQDALDSSRANSDNFLNPFEQRGISAEYNVDLPMGRFTYIGSFRDSESSSFRNTDYTGLNIFTVGASPEARALGGTNFDPNNNVANIQTITHEARLQGTAFDDRLDWLIGAYYSDEKIRTSGSLTLLDEYQAGVSVGLLGSPVNLLNIFAGGVDATGDFATAAFTQDGESVSIFTHNVLSVTDKLSLTVGLRYVDESKDGSFTQTDGQHNACFGTFANLANIPAALAGPSVALNCFVFAAPVFDPANPGPLFGAIAASPAAPLLGLLPQEFNDTFEDDEFVYTLKASYALTPDANIYGGFTHGFKSGGFNLDASAAAGGADPRFLSEEIDAWEAGLKVDFWDGRARANIAAFYQQMDNFQVLEFTGIRFQTFNVAKAQSSGVEFEGLAQLTDYLGASLAVTYTDARYPDDCATQNPADADFILNAASLCGHDLTNAPEWVGIFGSTFESPVLNGNANFFATGSVRYETDRRTSTQAVETGDFSVFLPGDIQEANAKVNLRIGLESEDEIWGIEIWGNNVFDERTKNVTFNIPLRGGLGNRARGQFVQDPATYGVTIRTKF